MAVNPSEVKLREIGEARREVVRLEKLTVGAHDVYKGTKDELEAARLVLAQIEDDATLPLFQDKA